MKKDINKLVSPRRTVDLSLPAGSYELSSGVRKSAVTYSTSPWAFACMNLRGTELGNIPWYIEKNGKRLQRHKLYDMLIDFGPESNYTEAIKATEIDLLLHGVAFWLRDVDILKRLNPETMKVVKSNHGISHFKQTIKSEDGNIVNIFDREEIIYFREFHPSDDLGTGVAVMDILKGPLSTEKEAEKMINAHFKNDAIPGLLLTTEENISEGEANRVVTWWNKRFKGSDKAGSVGVAGKGLKANKVASTFEESKLIEIREQARNDICVGFSVPSILVGNMTDATYVNAPEARKYFIENLIIPRATAFANFINQDLVKVVDPNAKFVFAPEELPILQEGESAKHKRLVKSLEAGVITKEYFAEQMGYPKVAVPEDPEAEPLRQWRDKAINALNRDEEADVEFETDVISVDKQHLLHGRLSNAETVEDVKRAFND